MNRNYKILLKGKSTTGKTTSLENLRNQENWLYLNTDCGKNVPIPNCGFNIVNITDVEDFFHVIETVTTTDRGDKYKEGGIITDTLNYAMEMFETQKVNTASDKDKFSAWAAYKDRFRCMMFEHTAKFPAPFVCLAHVFEELDQAGNIIDSSVPIQGSLKKVSVEAFFSQIVQTRKLDISKEKTREALQNGQLSFDEEELEIGIKYAYQLFDTKDNKEAKLRNPRGIIPRTKPYMNADLQQYLDMLDTYYGFNK